MRVLFAGTPGFALEPLAELHRSQRHEIVAVLTNPDRTSGRGRKIQHSAVKEVALELNLPIIQPERLDSSARKDVMQYSPDIMVVVAYGKIFGPKFLALFPHGGINLHPSLLPRYRGPAPIPAAILSGENVSGITVQHLGLEMDAGDIILQEEFDISDTSTTPELIDYTSQRGARLLVSALDSLEDGTAPRISQHHEDASYCSLLRKEDGEINWLSSAVEISRQIRAFLPWPGAYTWWKGLKLGFQECRVIDRDQLPHLESEGSGRQISGSSGAGPGTVIGVDKSHGILIITGTAYLSVTRLQLQGRKAMDWKSFVNGNPDILSSRLGAAEQA